MLERFNPDDFHELLLEIYDSDAQNRFVKADRIRISSWYNKATVGYGDILGDGKEFIFVESEANTGTGILEMILTVIGWHKNKFVPVLLETYSYYESLGRDFEELKVSHRFTKLGTKSVSLYSAYLYHEVKEGSDPRSVTWNDSLKWNERTFSFYDKQAERHKMKNAKVSIQKSISERRLTIRNRDFSLPSH